MKNTPDTPDISEIKRVIFEDNGGKYELGRLMARFSLQKARGIYEELLNTPEGAVLTHNGIAISRQTREAIFLAIASGLGADTPTMVVSEEFFGGYNREIYQAALENGLIQNGGSLVRLVGTDPNETDPQRLVFKPELSITWQKTKSLSELMDREGELYPKFERAQWQEAEGLYCVLNSKVNLAPVTLDLATRFATQHEPENDPPYAI